MKVVVLLAAFTDRQTRTVDIGDVEFAGTPEEQQLALLDAVFVQGQNEIDPMPCPSVSAGDIIFHNGIWLVDHCGFSPLTDKELESYLMQRPGERLYWFIEKQRKPWPELH